MSLVLASVDVNLGGATLLRDCSHEFREGALSIVIGPNGAGKSSLLRTCAGTLTATRGQVLIDGDDLAGLPLTERARRLAMLYQQHGVAFPFTVREIVSMGRHPWGEAAARTRQISEALLTEFSLTALADRDVMSLSGGEQQRVQLARVLAQREGQGGYVLLDEPTSALDLEHQQLLFERLRIRADAGIGVIVATHDLNLAARYADKLVVMADQQIVNSGSPAEVMTSLMIREVFQVEATILADDDDVPQVAVRSRSLP